MRVEYADVCVRTCESVCAWCLGRGVCESVCRVCVRAYVCACLMMLCRLHFGRFGGVCSARRQRGLLDAPPHGWQPSTERRRPPLSLCVPHCSRSAQTHNTQTHSSTLTLGQRVHTCMCISRSRSHLHTTVPFQSAPLVLMDNELKTTVNGSGTFGWSVTTLIVGDRHQGSGGQVGWRVNGPVPEKCFIDTDFNATVATITLYASGLSLMRVCVCVCVYGVRVVSQFGQTFACAIPSRRDAPGI